ncbi:hypothetical protein PR202_gb27794 [Eleusine coracana subsp. coracana]|uniref:No apical meristem-associated C-terminal domain-containing protein n=1 Tax=Eleusine coracana subsp. coracana TaxID=191504 RepID=A0AAV5FUS8_ELECO|nr:hypothetical protein PR202_gb27794 [Eleusine coracana subsp. coracana]
MVKGKGKTDGDGPSRERTINWDDDQTKFMLDWYIVYMKGQHAGFKFKKQHHMKCADALNKEFAMGSQLLKLTFTLVTIKRTGRLNDMGNYALPEEQADDDSDTLPSPFTQKNGENNSSSTSRTGMKCPRGNKSPSKKQKKPKSRLSESTEQLNSTLVSLQKFLAAPAPQVPPPPPSHASLWERREAMTITTDDKIAVGQYLAHKEKEVDRYFGL